MIRSMAFSQKYTLVSPIEPMTAGDTFNSHEWPLHVTIADTFAIEAIDSIVEKLLNITEAQHAFKISGEKKLISDQIKVLKSCCCTRPINCTDFIQK